MMSDYTSKLDVLADKSAQRSGNAPNYIGVTQALRDDLKTLFLPQLTEILHVVNELKSELSKCQVELKKSRENEALLLQKIKTIEKGFTSPSDEKSNSDGVYLVGCSILHEVKQNDILNEHVKCIRGGNVNDVRDNLKSLDSKPRTVISYIGGNDLMCEDATVEHVSEEYTILLTEVKNKFPEADVVVAGLVPRTEKEEVRTRLKDFNSTTKGWCSANGIKFIDTDECFELKSGHTDVSCYVICLEIHLQST